MASLFAGIDLGTTFTAAAVAGDEGRPEMVSLAPTATSIPSVVYMREDGSMATGHAALQMAAAEPDRVAREFKRRVGDPAPILIAGAPLAAHLLMGRLLKWVLERVEERHGRTIDHAVVTHPANWGEYKRDYLRQAAERAGVRSWSPLTEPEAAAMHYASRETVEPGDTVAVYDLGGGTFDVTVLRKIGTGFEFVGRPQGIENLGGIDLDQALFTHVADQVADHLDGLDPTDPAVLAALHRLRADIETAKITLSSETTTSLPVSLPGLHENIRLTRDEFEALVRPTLVETTDGLRQAVLSAGVQPDELAKVLLVGGSSRIPLVGQLVAQTLGRPVAVDADPKHAVALGAALHARSEFADLASAGRAPAAPSVTSPAAPGRDEDDQQAAVPDATTRRAGTRGAADRRWWWLAAVVVAAAAVAAILVTTAGGGGGDTAPRADIVAINTVDAGGNSGLFTSMVLTEAGLPLIAHQEGSNGVLVVAACSDPACSTVETTVVDSSGDVGAFTAMVLGDDGSARIAYVDAAAVRQDLKLAICDGPSCGSSTLLTIDSGAVVAAPTAITLGAGSVPVLVYRRSAPGAVLGATCGNAACSNRSGFTIDDGGAGGVAATTTPDGALIVAYQGPDGDLRATDCPACPGAEVATLDADEGATLAGSVALALDSGGSPIIAYSAIEEGSPSGSLRVAHCSDTACTEPRIRTIPNSESLGGDISMAVTPGGRPVIAWYHAATSSLHLTVCGEPACRSTATFLVDDEGDVGMHTSIAVTEDGLVTIAYHDASNGALKVARVTLP